MNPFVFVLAFTAATAPSAGGESYPASTEIYFPRGALDDSFAGKRIAVEGTITRIAQGPIGKPLLELSLSLPQPQKIWVASTMRDGMALHEVGDPVRALGYLTATNPSDLELMRVSSDKYFLIGYCIYDLADKKGQFLPAGLKDCRAWKAGTKAEDLP